VKTDIQVFASIYKENSIKDMTNLLSTVDERQIHNKIWSITYLTDDIFVCKTYNHPILGGVVLIFLLNSEAFSGIIICPTL